MSPTDLVPQKVTFLTYFHEFSCFSGQSAFSPSGLLASPVRSCPVDTENPTKPGKHGKWPKNKVKWPKNKVKWPKTGSYSGQTGSYRGQTGSCSGQTGSCSGHTVEMQCDSVPGPVPRCHTRTCTTPPPGTTDPPG